MNFLNWNIHVNCLLLGGTTLCYKLRSTFCSTPFIKLKKKKTYVLVLTKVPLKVD